MDPIKEAFSKIKQDINNLQNELKVIKKALLHLYEHSTERPLRLDNLPNSTNNPTDKQTDILPLEGLKSPNKPISSGNRGVPTDKQTNRQTDKHAENTLSTTNLANAGAVLDSLDSIKETIGKTFKNLTSQEMLVFSTIYSLEDINTSEITYKTVADMLKLSESSIRDYINKLIKKGVPILKNRQNNKTILLNISPELKKMAKLDTLLALRDL